MIPEFKSQQTTSGKPMEHDFIIYPDIHHVNGDMTSKVSMSPEVFQKLYLSPQSNIRSNSTTKFGNPTPVGLLGTVLSLTPLSCDLMGWRGAGGNGAASVGAYLFFGGLLLIISGLLEFVLGNTFPFVVFMSFGAFWLTFAVTLQTSYGAFAAYAPPNSTSPAAGLATKGFNASFGFLLLFMGLLCLVFLICSLRTNLVYVVVYASLVVGFGLLTGQHFQLAVGNVSLAAGLQVAGGASLFLTSMAAWWMFFAIMLEALEFPFKIPVGDLSWLIRGPSRRSSWDENSLA